MFEFIAIVIVIHTFGSIIKDSLTNMSFSKLRKASGRWWGNIRGNKSRENEADGCDIEENRSVFGF